MPCQLEMAKIKCKYANRKAKCDLLGIGNSNVCPIRSRLRDNHYELPKYTRFKFFAFKMKVKDVDDLDENLHVNLLCQLCKNWRF